MNFNWIKRTKKILFSFEFGWCLLFEHMQTKSRVFRYEEINWLNIANELLHYCGHLFDIFTYSKVKCDCVIIGYYYFFLSFCYCCSHNRIDVMRCDAMKEYLCWHKTIITKQWRSVFVCVRFSLFMVCVWSMNTYYTFFMLYNRESSLIFHVY